MTLSLNKLEKVLSSKGMIIKKIYTISNLCVYIELMHINNVDSIMLYIPSKYEIDAGQGNNTYKIHFLELNDDGTIPNDYADSPDDIEMENKYEEVDINVSTIGQYNIEKYLEESYKCPVSLKEVEKNDINELKDVFRQLKRLKFCVQSLKYKLCIFYKCYICCIRRDNTYECYSIENFTGNRCRNLAVTTDLETFYEKINTMDTDVKNVRRGVFHVLDKNQNKNVCNLQKIMDYKNTFELLSNQVTEQKDKNKAWLEKLETLLSNLLGAEKNIIEDIMNIQEKYANKTSLHQDIEKSHMISKKENDLTNIQEIKQDIMRNIIKIKMVAENITLKFDQICFDNTVMLNTIVKNFDQLSKI